MGHRRAGWLSITYALLPLPSSPSLPSNSFFPSLPFFPSFFLSSTLSLSFSLSFSHPLFLCLSHSLSFLPSICLSYSLPHPLSPLAPSQNAHTPPCPHSPSPVSWCASIIISVSSPLFCRNGPAALSRNALRARLRGYGQARASVRALGSACLQVAKAQWLTAARKRR